MTDPREQAADLVSFLFERRLRQAGIAGGRGLMFELRPQEPEGYPGGGQVRVRTFRHWSDAWVKLDGDTGELLSFSIDRNAHPPSSVEIDSEQAFAIAASIIHVPEGAVPHHAANITIAKGCRAVEVEWQREAGGLRVDGDWLRLVFHPETRRVIEFERYWSALGRTE